MKRAETFFSYSRANSDFALKLGKDLKAAGGSVWIDQLDIPTGARWDEAVENALEESSNFLVILSPESINSENVKDEIGYAIDAGKRILPILIKACTIPLRLRRFQYVDFSHKPYIESLEETKKLLGISCQENIETETKAETQSPATQSEAIVKQTSLSAQVVSPYGDRFNTGQGTFGEKIITVGKVSRRNWTRIVPVVVVAISALAVIITSTITNLPHGTATPSSTSESGVKAEQAVRDVVNSEIRAVLQSDMDLLQSIYAPTAKIVDHRATPNDTSDDLVYEGWTEIRQRYEGVFALHLYEIKLADLTIQVNGKRATATHSGSIINGEFYPDHVVYSLEQVDGRWIITLLESDGLAQ